MAASDSSIGNPILATDVRNDGDDLSTLEEDLSGTELKEDLPDVDLNSEATATKQRDHNSLSGDFISSGLLGCSRSQGKLLLLSLIYCLLIAP
jgi:hypothetical protein